MTPVGCRPRVVDVGQRGRSQPLDGRLEVRGRREFRGVLRTLRTGLTIHGSFSRGSTGRRTAVALPYPGWVGRIRSARGQPPVRPGSAAGSPRGGRRGDRQDRWGRRGPAVAAGVEGQDDRLSRALTPGDAFRCCVAHRAAGQWAGLRQALGGGRERRGVRIAHGGSLVVRLGSSHCATDRPLSARANHPVFWLVRGVVARRIPVLLRALGDQPLPQPASTSPDS